MSLLKDNDPLLNINGASSLENLEKQILEAAADSPARGRDHRDHNRNNIVDSSKFQFDSRDDSFAALDSALEESAEGTQENKMYDMIISRVLNNPKIDKRTLLQKFISKIEMESNLNAGISSEISTIKELINKESSVTDDQLGGDHHAISQHTNNGHYRNIGHELKSLKQSKEHHGGKDQAQSMKLIKANKGSLDASAAAGQAEQEDSEIMLNVPSETMAG